MKFRTYKPRPKTPLYISHRRFHISIGKHYAFWPLPSFFLYTSVPGFVFGMAWFNIGVTCLIKTNYEPL